MAQWAKILQSHKDGHGQDIWGRFIALVNLGVISPSPCEPISKLQPTACAYHGFKENKMQHSHGKLVFHKFHKRKRVLHRIRPVARQSYILDISTSDAKSQQSVQLKACPSAAGIKVAVQKSTIFKSHSVRTDSFARCTCSPLPLKNVWHLD